MFSLFSKSIIWEIQMAVLVQNSATKNICYIFGNVKKKKKKKKKKIIKQLHLNPKIYIINQWKVGIF